MVNWITLAQRLKALSNITNMHMLVNAHKRLIMLNYAKIQIIRHLGAELSVTCSLCFFPVSFHCCRSWCCGLEQTITVTHPNRSVVESWLSFSSFTTSSPMLTRLYLYVIFIFKNVLKEALHQLTSMLIEKKECSSCNRQATE